MSFLNSSTATNKRTLWAMSMMGWVAGIFLISSRFILPEESYDPWWQRLAITAMVFFNSAMILLSPSFRRLVFEFIYVALLVMCVWSLSLMFLNDFSVQFSIQFFTFIVVSAVVFQHFRLLILFFAVILLASFAFYFVLDQPIINPFYFYLVEMAYMTVLTLAMEQVTKEREKLIYKGKQQRIISQTAFDHSEEGMLVIGPKNRILQFNQAFLKMWNIEKEELEIGKISVGIDKVKQQLIDPEDFEKFSQFTLLNPDQDSSQIILLKDGRLFERYCQALLDSTTPIGRIWFFKDLTEVNREKIRVEARNKMLKQERKALLYLALSPNVQNGNLLPAFREIMSQGQTILGIDKVVIWMAGNHPNQLNCCFVDGFDGLKKQDVPALEKDQLMDYCRQIQKVRVLRIPNFSKTLLFNQVKDKHSLIFSNARMDIPLRLGSEVMGIISFQADSPKKNWLTEEVSFLGSLGDVALLALESSKRKETESQLEEYIAVLKSVFEMSGLGIIITSNKGLALDYNENYLKMWKIPVSMMVPGKEKEVVAHSQALLAEKEVSVQAIKYLASFPTKNRHDILHLKDGRIIERNTEVLWVRNQVEGRIWYFKDITQQVESETALRKSEAHHRAIVNAVPDLLFRINKFGKLLDVKIPDYPEYHELSQRPLLHLRDLFEDDFCQEMIEEINHALKNRAKFELDVQLEFLGSVKDLEIRIVPSGENEVLAIVRNVTMRKITERELIQRNFELDSFVYRASHDLKAPLNSLMGLIDIIQNEDTPPELLNYIKLMDRSVVKLDTFIRNLADFSRISRLAIQDQIVNVQELVNEVIESLQYMQHADQIETTVSIKGNSPLFGDRFHIGIVLSNLLSNAVKYQDYQKENRFVNIEVEILPEQVNIRIDDNGIGIPKKHQEKLFKLFFRASNQSFGSGLGLYITKNAVEKMKGKINLQSVEGLNTTYEITFPNKKPAQTPSA